MTTMPPGRTSSRAPIVACFDDMRRRQPQSFETLVAGPDWSNAPYASAPRKVGTAGLTMVQVKNNPAGDYPDPPVDEYVLTLLERGAGRLEYDLGVCRDTAALRKGDLIFAPAKQALNYSVEYDFDISVVSLPVGILREAMAGMGRGGASLETEALHVRPIRDPLLTTLTSNLIAEGAAGCPSGSLYADNLGYLIAANLMRLAGKAAPPRKENGALHEEALARVVTMMDDRITEQIPVLDLAQALDMNVYSFSRAFRAATGISPLQFLIQRRIERAQDLLANTNKPLGVISDECGFSNQSHMTSTFSRNVGVSPGKWRTERRGARARLSPGAAIATHPHS